MTVRIRVIPCLDVADGRVVKGVNFVDLKDAGDPVEQARAYDAAGADELCFLDISASHEGRGTLLDMVRRTAEVCFMPLTVGGGVRTPEDARALLLAGADKVAVNSAAVARPELVGEIAERFGSQCVVASVDARRTPRGNWEIFTHGGRKPTGIDAVEYARKVSDLGAGAFSVPSMDGAGTPRGPDREPTPETAGRPAIAPPSRRPGRDARGTPGPAPQPRRRCQAQREHRRALLTLGREIPGDTTPNPQFEVVPVRPRQGGTER